MRVECAIQTDIESTVNGNSKQENPNFYVCATETLWMPSLEDYFAIYFLEGDIQYLSFRVPFKSKETNKQTNKQTVNQLYQESKNQDAQSANDSLQ